MSALTRADEYAYSPAGQEAVDCPKCKGGGLIYGPVVIGAPGVVDDRACEGCSGTGSLPRFWADRYRREWW